MKGRIFICSVVVLAILLFLASMTLAMQCDQEGKVAVTIVNKAGKVIEICVPETAVEHIGGASDVVIPATCPCWTAETIASLVSEGCMSCPPYQNCVPLCLSDAPPATTWYRTTFDLIIPNTDVIAWVYACTFPPEAPFCDLHVSNQALCPLHGTNVHVAITWDQFQACSAILMNSELWTMCDGS